jgi:hypothetical protein
VKDRNSKKSITGLIMEVEVATMPHMQILEGATNHNHIMITTTIMVTNQIIHTHSKINMGHPTRTKTMGNHMEVHTMISTKNLFMVKNTINRLLKIKMMIL